MGINCCSPVFCSELRSHLGYCCVAESLLTLVSSPLYTQQTSADHVIVQRVLKVLVKQVIYWADYHHQHQHQLVGLIQTSPGGVPLAPEDLEAETSCSQLKKKVDFVLGLRKPEKQRATGLWICEHHRKGKIKTNSFSFPLPTPLQQSLNADLPYGRSQLKPCAFHHPSSAPTHPHGLHLPSGLAQCLSAQISRQS